MTIGKNKPLSAEKPKWKSEIAMTKAQLKSKQDEFWETSPAYEGRKEIWDALKAACETDDVSLAQAIIDGANISLPTGKLHLITSIRFLQFLVISLGVFIAVFWWNVEIAYCSQVLNKWDGPNKWGGLEKSPNFNKWGSK